MEVSINTNAMKVNYEQKPCYDIVFSKDFNLLNDEIQQLNISNKRICIVTESNVGPLYANEVKDIFMSNSKEVIIFEFTAGEAHKNLDTISELYTVLIENKFDRNDMLVALGGGVVGDMTGYAAATYLRGIDFIQIPTSLLAQVDSSIGGKTGVDYKAYKNMIGAFYQPKLVYMNLSTLNSLPDREYYSGMGEIVKHGLIKDSDYFYWLKENYQKILDRDYDTLFTMIYNSCNVKRKVVEEDPKEKGDRALLNFGHTIGHAVEKLKNFTLVSNKTKVATISSSGKIKAKKAGKAVITVKSKNNSALYATIKVKVKNRYTKDQLRLMSSIIYSEAGDQSYAGKKAVGIVIANRVSSRSYPNTLSGVIYQPGQFTPARNGSLNRSLALYDSGRLDKGSIKAAKAVLNGDKNVKLSYGTINMNSYLFFSGYVKGARLTIGGHQFK